MSTRNDACSRCEDCAKHGIFDTSVVVFMNLKGSALFAKMMTSTRATETYAVRVHSIEMQCVSGLTNWHKDAIYHGLRGEFPDLGRVSFPLIRMGEAQSSVPIFQSAIYQIENSVLFIFAVSMVFARSRIPH